MSKRDKDKGRLAPFVAIDREMMMCPAWRVMSMGARVLYLSLKRRWSGKSRNNGRIFSDFWNQQPVRCEVWSEKGTVRGVLAPVLDQYAVGFRVMHGFSSATVHDVCQDDDGRPLIVLYVGDFDPSGLFMSEEDLPKRLDKYGGTQVELKRIALTREQVRGLPPFPETDKRKDPRYGWFVARYGDRCWELDAMDRNDLRACVEKAIRKLIEPMAWKRCEIVNKAQQQSLKTIIAKWGKP
jgi:hypothetical protein